MLRVVGEDRGVTFNQVADTAQVRFISSEPLLESLVDIDLTGVHWLIADGESGSGFRSMKDECAIELRDLCQGKNVGFHFKQHSAFRNGTNPLLEGKQHFQPPIVQITRSE